MSRLTRALPDRERAVRALLDRHLRRQGATARARDVVPHLVAAFRPHRRAPQEPPRQPRSRRQPPRARDKPSHRELELLTRRQLARDRKSTRLNSSHVKISYAVFCLKKKKNNKYIFYLTKYKSKKINT